MTAKSVRNSNGVATEMAMQIMHSHLYIKECERYLVTKRGYPVEGKESIITYRTIKHSISCCR